MDVMRLLGYKDFFPNWVPSTKEHYAGKVGKDDIQRLCCLLLTYCKKGFTPPVDEIIKIWFQYMLKSYEDSPAYGFIANEYRRIVNTSGHNQYYLLSEEALLNMYIWSTENKDIPDSIDQQDGSFMVPLFQLYLLFNEDVLANFQKALASAQKHPAKVIMRNILAERFPQNDLLDIDYGKLVYNQTYKLMELLNFLDATPKYQPLYQHFLQDFGCADKEEFFKAMGGAVIIPLNPLKTGMNSLVLDETKEPEKSAAFLDKLVFDPGDVTVGPTDYKVLRDTPLQKTGKEYRVVFDLFLIKKLYNGILFKLSGYVNENKSLLKGQFFGEIRNDFVEGVLLYNTMNSALDGYPGVRITGNEFKGSNLQREPDYYYREDERVLLMESKDFFMPAQEKLSYDFDQIIGGLQVEGRLSKAVLQSATNALRVLKQELILDGGYNSSAITVYPVIVLHDSLYDCAGLNYWANEWFQEALQKLAAEPENKNLDLSRIRPITLVDIDTLILYRSNIYRGELDFFELLESFQQNADYSNVRELPNQNAIIPFSFHVENEVRKRRLGVDLRLIEDTYQASGYVDN